MVARVVPQSARRRHAESRKPDLWGWAARPKAPVLCAPLPPPSWRASHSLLRAAPWSDPGVWLPVPHPGWVPAEFDARAVGARPS
jgi:hypothetical protein